MAIGLLLLVGVAPGALAASGHGEIYTSFPALLDGSTRAVVERGSLVLSWTEEVRGPVALSLDIGAASWTRFVAEERALVLDGREAVTVEWGSYEEEGRGLRGAELRVFEARSGAFLVWITGAGGTFATQPLAHQQSTLAPARDPVVAEVSRGERANVEDENFSFRHVERGDVVRLTLPSAVARVAGDGILVLWGLDVELATPEGARRFGTGERFERAEDGVTTRHVWEYLVLRVSGASGSLEDPGFRVDLVARSPEIHHEGRAAFRDASGVLEVAGVEHRLRGARELTLAGRLDLEAFAAPPEGGPRLGLRVAGDLDEETLALEGLAPQRAPGPEPAMPWLLAAGLALPGAAGLWAAKRRWPPGARAARAREYREAADALLQASRPKEALRWYERSLRLAPRDAAGLAGKGAALLEQGRPEEALRSFEAALALQPGDGVVSYACATICARLGREREARRWLLRAARLAPDTARQCLRDPSFAALRARREFLEVARLLHGTRPRDGEESIAYH